MTPPDDLEFLALVRWVAFRFGPLPAERLPDGAVAARIRDVLGRRSPIRLAELSDEVGRRSDQVSRALRKMRDVRRVAPGIWGSA